MRQLPLLALMLTLPLLLAGQQDTLYCDNLEGLEYDHDGDMVVGINDVLQLLTWYGYNYDIDQDGMLDCTDDCVGEYDECGVCNGPGPQVLAIDTIIITYDSIYVEAIDEWLTYELSADTLFCFVCGELDTCITPFESCGDALAFDGYYYSTVTIGDQCWFAENLRTTGYANGDLIPAGLTNGEWLSTTSGATAVYGEGSIICSSNSPDIDACNAAQSLAAYGRLYNWYAVDDARGLCPTGWHVPTDGEWIVLEMELGMSESDANSTGWRSTDEGTQLKSTSGWYSGGNGTDDFGFSALPGGCRLTSNGYFSGAGYYGFWWSSSPDGGAAWARKLVSVLPEIERWGHGLREGFSVRCLRDAE